MLSSVKLIPAGTGMKRYRNIKINTEVEEYDDDDDLLLDDDDFYEEIEEILIMGDIGVNATEAIIEN